MNRPEPSAASRPDAGAAETPFRLPDGSGPDAPAFAEPWQAQAFALAVALHQRGVFTWSDWAAELSRQVARPDAAPDGSDYYRHWLAAIEALLSQKGIAGSEVIDAVSHAWQRAAHATPHGQPILLENDPERA